jgi:hypothetical protein
MGGRGATYGDGTEDASVERLGGIGERLASHELGAAVGELDHHGAVELLGGLENLEEKQVDSIRLGRGGCFKVRPRHCDRGPLSP